MKTWTEKQRDAALKKARSYARSGNAYYASYFVRRAASFDYVSDRQVKNVEKLLAASS